MTRAAVKEALDRSGTAAVAMATAMAKANNQSRWSIRIEAHDPTARRVETAVAEGDVLDALGAKRRLPAVDLVLPGDPDVLEEEVADVLHVDAVVEVLLPDVALRARLREESRVAAVEDEAAVRHLHVVDVAVVVADDDDRVRERDQPRTTGARRCRGCRP